MPDNLFTKEFAASYDDVRPIDTTAFRLAISEFLALCGGKSRTIVDAGCGTGRLLRPLVTCGVPADNILAIDVSAGMLSYAMAHDVLQGVRFVHDDIRAFGERDANVARFDAMILHWVLHCDPHWRAILDRAVRVIRNDGVLVWFEEDSDIYDWVDMNSTLDERNESGVVRKLFEVYFRGVRKMQKSFGLPADRPGTPVRNTPLLVRALQPLGWHVDESIEPHGWVDWRSLDWVVNRVLGARSFTNLRRVSAQAHALAMQKVDVEITRMRLARDLLIPLSFRLKTYIARRKAIIV